ncbi:SWI/SNF-related matrix-associated actin-dependent regulator of chromatin subfamily A member 3-like 2-like protein [Aphelenchoides avenae]|nr:SWI/SNF-related matrix-associated actin-dependent regulator of chromatin subfamily A member 3-like 2-like protein [Aphelenchus avenae]
MHFARLLRRIKHQLNQYRKPKAAAKKDSRGSTLAGTEDGCKICTNAFDDLDLLPIELACGHLACHECALGIWLRTSSLSCPLSSECASRHDDDPSEEDFLADGEQNLAELTTTRMLTYEDRYACCGYECLGSEGLLVSLMPPDLLDVLLKSPTRSLERSWWLRLSGIPYGL